MQHLCCCIPSGRHLMRVCAETGCPVLVRAGRCDKHRRAKDRARGTRQDRGYDADHERLAVKYQQRMDAGETFECWRCKHRLGPKRGADWVLGHCDEDRRKHHGPEHPTCNSATSGRTRCPHPSHM